MFDQFGVLIDGVTTYPQMPAFIAALKQRNKQVAVISNSGKRAAVSAIRLEKFGYGSIDRVYTSGEIAWQRLNELTASHTPDAPLRVFYLGNDADRSALEGLPITERETPHEAELIIIGGMGQINRSASEFRALLQQAAAGKVPAYCTNPDLLSFDLNGVIGPGPGGVARLYEEMGGPCEYFGKPYPELYRYALDDLAVDAGQALCIGDSIEHDVLGANRAGCGSLLVRTGVHSHLNGLELQALMQKLSIWPDYILNS